MRYDEKIVLEAYTGANNSRVRFYIPKYYQFLFKQAINNRGCTSCLKDAAIKILLYMRKDNKYILKSTEVIKWKGKLYTHATITDDVAIAFLKKSEKGKSLFKVIPKEIKKEAVK